MKQLAERARNRCFESLFVSADRGSKTSVTMDARTPWNTGSSATFVEKQHFSDTITTDPRRPQSLENQGFSAKNIALFFYSTKFWYCLFYIKPLVRQVVQESLLAMKGCPLFAKIEIRSADCNEKQREDKRVSISIYGFAVVICSCQKEMLQQYKSKMGDESPIPTFLPHFYW